MPKEITRVGVAKRKSQPENSFVNITEHVHLAICRTEFEDRFEAMVFAYKLITIRIKY